MSSDWHNKNKERDAIRGKTYYVANKICWKNRYKKNRDSLLAKQRIYRQLPIPKLKVLARATLNRATRQGKLKRLPCEICNNPDSQGHHEDYTKPLDVRWFCRKHHIEHDRSTK